uniref:CCR4-NOT transcription complex subunit 4-like isoform X2 n=1 Tax=Saccoglossus kowalevskii TaxID=10224 RepID=A0ABM0M8Z9_SACKO|nr:PREDICTED: CCR4-NOT transcription complex subunit 4-like isoform X2 [Saccoglossus kowalevskii]
MANNNNHEDPMECPLCMEALEMDDVNFFPCTCGYQICRFCWHRIRTDENGLCPACRKPYPEHPADFKPLSEEELQKIKNEKKQKDMQRKQKISENRKHLASVRVVQKNLVFVVGLSQRLADPEILKKHEYFGKFGKIVKVVINQSTSYAGSQGPSASAYVTYQKSEDALKAIQAVNNVFVDGRTLKASLGTTKYCSHFLKNAQCPKPDCMYLHELGDEAASFTKEDMQLGKHQDYERKLLEQLFGGGVTSTNDGHTAPRLNTTRKAPSPPIANTNKEAWPSLQKSTETNKQPPSPPHPQLPQEMSPTLVPNDIDDINHTVTVGSPPCNHQLPSPRGDLHITTNGIATTNGIRTTNGILTTNDTLLTTQIPPTVEPLARSIEQRISPFNGLHTDNSSSLFSNTFMPPLRPVPPPPVSVPNANTLPTTNDWQDSMFGNDTLPISSSTNWQEAFGFTSIKDKQEDELGFDPWDESSKGLAEIMEKELQLNSTENNRASPEPDRTQPPPGFNNHVDAFQSAPTPVPSQRPPYRPDLVGSKMMSWMPHTYTQPSNSVQHSSEPRTVKDWQDGLRALLPNINISFGQQGLSVPPQKDNWNSASNQSNWPTSDPAIITSITVSSAPSTSYTNANSDRESNLSESPPHWMKSLHTLTEVDSPTHINNFYPAHIGRAGSWFSQQPPPPGFPTSTAGVHSPTEPQQSL